MESNKESKELTLKNMTAEQVLSVNKIQIEEEQSNDQNIEAIKLIVDIQYKSLIEAASILSKGLPIYFTILAAVFAYFIGSENLDKGIIDYAVYFAVAMTICVLAGYTTIIYGIIKGFNNLKDTIKLASKEIYDKSKIENFIKQGMFSIKATMVAFYIIAIIICIGLLRLPSFLG